MPTDASDFAFDFDAPVPDDGGFTFFDLDDEAEKVTLVAPDDDWDPTRTGTRFGEYTVVGMLGHGAMGLVLRGQRTRDKLPVAIKVLKQQLGQSAKSRERFRREALAVAKVRHPNIIELLASGIQRGRPFMVLELLQGGSVRDLFDEHLKQGDPCLPVARVVEIARMTLDGLGAAHASGILHRDIKPDNLLLDARGRVKLADFGLVKIMKDAGSLSGATPLTMTGAMVGTPLYMAPEQIVATEKVDARSDLYAVGVLVYELLTGSLPFPGARSSMAIHTLQASGPAPRVSRLREVPKALDDAVARLLAYHQKDRFQDAGQARDALLAIATAPPRIKLTIQHKQAVVHEGRLQRGERLVLGRSRDAGVQLEHKGLSRFHARLELTPRGLELTDLESTNGTFVQGTKLTRPTLLAQRDRIRLGKTLTLAVHWSKA